MNKIWLVAKREYTTRVRNKTFLLSTFLLPLAFIAFIAGSAILAAKGKDEHKIAVVGDSGYLKGVLKNSKNVVFDYTTGIDSTNYQSKGYTDVLVFPAIKENKNIQYILRSPKQVGSSVRENIESSINKAMEDKMLLEKGISSTMLDSLRKAAPNATLKETTDKEGGAKLVDSGTSSVIGLVCGVLIYMMMFIYGAQVMRGVMEEKTSRIAEVIVSSVKPFQLMLGKIFGIGAVGLTQFLLWIILIFGLATLAGYFLPHDWMVQAQEAQQNSQVPGGMSGLAKASSHGPSVFDWLSSHGAINLWEIVLLFLFYFLGGYLFYAALFASVGCMVNEDPQEAQSLMFPITMPIIFGFIIMQSTIQNPNSSLAFWGSIIPFTSPIVMMARIPSGPPAWQIILSMVLLVGGFIFTGWMAGKIYRIGILMYGKKGTWKEMMKWVFRA